MRSAAMEPAAMEPAAMEPAAIGTVAMGPAATIPAPASLSRIKHRHDFARDILAGEAQEDVFQRVVVVRTAT